MKQKNIMLYATVLIILISFYHFKLGSLNRKYEEALKGQINYTAITTKRTVEYIDELLSEGNISEIERNIIHDNLRTVTWSLDRLGYQLEYFDNHSKFEDKIQQYSEEIEAFKIGIIDNEQVSKLNEMKRTLNDFENQVDKLLFKGDKNLLDEVDSIIYYE